MCIELKEYSCILFKENGEQVNQKIAYPFNKNKEMFKLFTFNDCKCGHIMGFIVCFYKKKNNKNSIC